MDITEKVINQAIADFDSIKLALEDSGVEVPYGTDTKEYAGLIKSMGDKPYQKGYTDGYDTGYNEGYSKCENELGEDVAQLDNIKTIIDESGVLEDSEATVTEKVEQLVDKGEEYNYLYNLLGTQPNATYRSLFLQHNTIKHLPKLRYDGITELRYFCSQSTLESVDYYINSSLAVDCYEAFFRCSNLKFVYGINLSNATNVYELFKQCPLLEVIQEPLDISKNTSDCSGMVIGCMELKEIRFVEGCIIKQAPNFANCSKLSIESIQSIIDGLAVVETTKTLYFHSSITNSLTEEQITQILDKNWNIG